MKRSRREKGWNKKSKKGAKSLRFLEKKWKGSKLSKSIDSIIKLYSFYESRVVQMALHQGIYPNRKCAIPQNEYCSRLLRYLWEHECETESKERREGKRNEQEKGLFRQQFSSGFANYNYSFTKSSYHSNFKSLHCINRKIFASFLARYYWI